MTDQVSVTYAIDDEQLPQLLELFRTTWWMASRTEAETTRILQHTDLVIALTHRSSRQLLGFARILTDYTHIALVLDVVVSPQHRGTGYGAVLMDAITQHPSLRDVRSLELVCQPDLVPFYRRWGFTDEVGHSLLMRRTNDPRLAP